MLSIRVYDIKFNKKLIASKKEANLYDNDRNSFDEYDPPHPQ